MLPICWNLAGLDGFVVNVGEGPDRASSLSLRTLGVRGDPVRAGGGVSFRFSNFFFTCALDITISLRTLAIGNPDPKHWHPRMYTK